MSTAQRFAWLDGLSTVAVCGLAIAVLPPEAPASAWGMAARIAAVTLVCIVAFYYNDLYNFEVPHDVGQLFVRLCRALGLSALVLAGGYLMFPNLILGGNLASYALLLTLICVLALRVAVYTLAKRAPFSEAVLLLGGGALAVESLTPSALIFGDGFRVSRAQLALKRAMSVVIASVALLATAPLIALIALGIKLESRGPVFFIQERIGLGGRPFRLIKFRTMRPLERGADGIWQRDNDSRVTRFGAILRRYRLDEFPQCVNILRGDMSLVGPRPEMASNVATFSAVIPFYNLRHEVRPGLTGWAQVRAGYSMSTEEVTRKLCYDLYYIKHLSLRFDLWILFDTVKFVLSGKRPG